MHHIYLKLIINAIANAYDFSQTLTKNERLTSRNERLLRDNQELNLQNSIDVFEGASEYLRSFDSDDRTILQYIIGAISDLDTPKTPSAKGAYGLTAFLCNAKMENIQKNRDELLGTTKESIRGLADYVDAFMSDECLCVIGSAEKIEESKELFNSVEQLIGR